MFSQYFLLLINILTSKALPEVEHDHIVDKWANSPSEQPVYEYDVMELVSGFFMKNDSPVLMT